jgi:hypothetical protein
MGYTVKVNNAVRLISVNVHVHNLRHAERVYLESIRSQRLWSYCLETCTCVDHYIYIHYFLH